MAEPKIKYQFGLKSLDMDSYIRNIGNNVRSYIDYNRKHRGWTDDQVNEFSQSYDRYLKAMQDQLKGNTNRFSTNDLGDIIDSQGEFSNIDMGASGQPEEFYYNGKGERIDQATYDALKDKKKRKYTTFNANREVAEFFRRVGTKMSEYKDPPKEKFDVNKHGFVAWWNKKYNPSGEEAFIEPYLELDPVGADGKRPVTNRAKKAAGWLNEYLESMADSDLDFSEYAINNLQDYLNRGRELATEWGNGNWNPEDLIKALEYGIGSNFSKEFFSTEKDPRLSPEQRQALAEQEALQQQLAQQQQQLALQNQQNTDIQNWIQEQINKYNETEGLSVDVQRDGSYLIATDTPLQEYRLPADIDPFANPNYDQYANDFQLSLDESGNYVFPENGYQNSLQSIHSDDFDYNGQHHVSPYNIRNGNEYDPNKLMALLRLRALNISQLERDRSYNKYTAKALVANMLGGPDPYGQVIIGDENNPYNGMIYIPNEYIEEALNRALIFDPNTKTFKYVFVGYIPTIWEDRKAQKLREMGINPNALNPSDFAFLIPQHKEGGTIKTVVKAQNGMTLSQAALDRINKRNSDYASTFATTREDIINKNVNASGLSREAYMRHKRPVSKGLFKDASDDLFNGIEGGFTSRDQWQLANIGADIVSMLSAFVPGYGTLVSAGTGAASTVSQYVHDLTGGENFWSSTGNMLVGLGLDAVGLIPGFGATSKGAKIAKNLLKYVPRLAVAVSSYEGLKNAPQIMASLKKAKNDEDLTVDDWKNISQAIGLVTGLGGGAVRRVNTRHVATHLDENSKLLPNGSLRNLVRKPTDTGDIAVQLRNKKTGIVETKRYTGDEAKALANADTPDKMRDIIFKNKPALGDYELVTASTVRPHLRWGWPPTYHPERVRAMAVQRSANGKEYAETKGWFNEDVRPATELTGEAAYRRAVSENPDVLRAARASNNYEGLIPKRTAKLAETDKAIADIRTKASDYQRDNGLTGGIAEIDKQITTINAQRRGAAGAKKDALFKQKKQDLLDLEAQIQAKEVEVNGIMSMSPRKGLKKAQQELEDLKRQHEETKKWISDHDNSVIKGLNKHKKALEEFDAQIGRQTLKKNFWEGVSDKGHTVAFTNLRAKAKDGKLQFVDPMNPSYTIERQFDDLIKELGIKYKVGGKFQSGGGIRDVNSNANWFTHMYSSDEMKNWLNTFDTSNYQNFNHLQTTWKQNLVSSGYTPGGQAIYNSGVLVRQPQWNQTGTNAVIGRLNQDGTMTGHGGTTDHAAGNYTDGYFGSQEYLRHGGSHDSWNGHSTELQALQEQFKAKGLEYYEDTDGMFKLRPLNATQPIEQPADQTTNSATQPQNHDDDVTNSTAVDRQRLTRYIDPKWMALGQAMYANAINNRMTDRALSTNKPVLYDPKNDTRYLQGDLDAEMQGERAAGQLMHIASQPITSDGSLYAATMQDAAAKAEEYKIQGRTTNNTALRKRAEEILEQRMTDHAFNYDVAMKNRYALYQTAANRTTLLNARDAKNYDNQKTLFDEVMYDVKTDWNKRRSLQESLDRADIHSRVLDNLEQYVPDLTEEEKAVWERVRTGQTTPSQLQGTESIAYRSALKKASQAETNQLRIMYGIAPVEYTSTTTEDPIRITKLGGVLISGDGSKIRVAKIRAESRERIKDADRMYRTAKDRHDRTDKNIARADKKMYPLNKPISSRKRKK